MCVCVCVCVCTQIDTCAYTVYIYEIVHEIHHG